MKNIKVIAFDADDTLFINETYFAETEEKFCSLMSDYLSNQGISKELFKVEIDNLRLYGYGIKGYILSMIEAAMSISNHTLPIEMIAKIIQYGKELLEKPIVLLDGVEETLDALHGKYKLVVATKGDLLDQRRKLHNSGLGHYFHHIEVMSDKQEVDYTDLIKRLEIEPSEFFMIGNSLKSDVLPVLAIGGHAVHIPFHTTWAHEKIDHKVVHANFSALEKITDVLKRLE
ncbi:putative hydrolase of the HAD superfamily [Flavobacterium sp. CG_9.1]|jgi:putative hydrolase of the HAD superfamily|uniref:Putative hydrolase of the HAD superfamily n=1 Tax=Flavobacterium xanthum TaxID=69322 RepID=A0A1M7AMX0_9FLAO|nr:MULTISPECIES: HAD family hydrolase [Flavobacterium]MBG6060830.1 putative hydrolase of the HAD superfamily [Flavobacterium sp. CG_9.1]SHL44143.1 putative hydrolase of the HAD superfamily [Flavobacterium xanthum]